MYAVVPIGFTLWLGVGSYRYMHVILAHILRYQNCVKLKGNRGASLAGNQIGKEMRLIIHTGRAQKRYSMSKVNQNPGHHVLTDEGIGGMCFLIIHPRIQSIQQYQSDENAIYFS